MQKEVPFNMALESRYPEQVAIAIARDPQGKYNPITLGWVMPTSSRPPMFAIAIGKSRYSLEAIRKSREFVLAFPSELQADAAKLFGSRSGRDMDKLRALSIQHEPAHQIDSRLLTDAVANFECRVVQEIESGDHVVFIGEVVCSHVIENPLNRLFTLVKAQHMGGFRQK